MQLTRKHLTVAFLASMAVLAVASLAGVPLVSHDTWAALAAAGAMPMALTGETGGDIQKALGQLTDVAKAAQQAVADMKKAHNEPGWSSRKNARRTQGCWR